MSDRFSVPYHDALERYVETHGEEALSAAYDLGRAAVREGLSVLDLASIHHAVLAEMPPGSVRAGGEFFLEALSAFELVQRVLQNAREAAQVERRQAVILRRLSAFLADASLALDAAGSLDEMLQLVAEHAREVVGARRCVVRVTADRTATGTHVAVAGDDAGLSAIRLAAPLTTLDGRAMGAVELFGSRAGRFSELDAALLRQLAQMASAALERTWHYSR